MNVRKKIALYVTISALLATVVGVYFTTNLITINLIKKDSNTSQSLPTLESEDEKDRSLYFCVIRIIDLLSKIKGFDDFSSQKQTSDIRFIWGKQKVEFDYQLGYFKNLKVKNQPHDTQIIIDGLLDTSKDAITAFQGYSQVMMKMSNFVVVQKLSGNLSSTEKENISELLNQQTIAKAKLDVARKRFNTLIDCCWKNLFENLSYEEKKHLLNALKHEFGSVINEYLGKKLGNDSVFMKEREWIVINMYEYLSSSQDEEPELLPSLKENNEFDSETEHDSEIDF